MQISNPFKGIEVPSTGAGSVNPNSTDVGTIISAILPYIFYAAGLVLLVYLVLGGLQMMTSRGDPKAMESAKGKITNALIGFVIVIFAFFIVQLVGKLLGIDQFGIIFK